MSTFTSGSPQVIWPSESRKTLSGVPRAISKPGFASFSRAADRSVAPSSTMPPADRLQLRMCRRKGEHDLGVGRGVRPCPGITEEAAALLALGVLGEEQWCLPLSGVRLQREQHFLERSIRHRKAIRHLAAE